MRTAGDLGTSITGVREMTDEPVQDALLVYYNGLARVADVNVERQIDEEAFDYRWYMLPRLPKIARSFPSTKETSVSSHRGITE